MSNHVDEDHQKGMPEEIEKQVPISMEEEMKNKKPICLLVIGMAGSGKTTLMQRLSAYANDNGIKNYVMNLDPAVSYVPYGCNIDIRDTVDYKEVMKSYALGPNGGIMTALNLFATRFDQVVDLISKRSNDLDYTFIDTPGQIEAFTWSASGSIITESLAVTFPSVVVYVVDTPRTTNPNTFMSNMLYACSILYKVGLPFILVFNKVDVLSHQYAVEWMNDFQLFQKALDDIHDDSYMNSLSRSLSLVLEEFYSNLRTVGVSAATGEGMDSFFKATALAAEEYDKEYLPDLLLRIQKKNEKKELSQVASMNKLMEDMNLAASEGGTTSPTTSTTTSTTTQLTNVRGPTTEI